MADLAQRDLAQRMTDFIIEHATDKKESDSSRRGNGAALITWMGDAILNGDIKIVLTTMTTPVTVKTHPMHEYRGPFTLKHADTCKYCKNTMEPGDKGMYLKLPDGPQKQNNGPYHEGCAKIANGHAV